MLDKGIFYNYNDLACIQARNFKNNTGGEK